MGRWFTCVHRCGGGLSAFGLTTAVNIVGSVFAIVLLASLVTLLTVALENGVLTLLVAGSVFLVLPFIVSPLGLFGRIGLSQLGNYIFTVLPGTLASNLMAPALDRPDITVGSLLGLLAWICLLYTSPSPRD